MKNHFGAILLIAGCCIGVGMLGIPVMTGSMGFASASCIFVVAWAYMVLTGLVFQEVTLSFKQDEINLVTMVSESLGIWYKRITIALFGFLFYSIMIAYYIAAGGMIQQGLSVLFGCELSFTASCIFLIVILFGLIYRGVHSVDIFNRWVMALLLLSYIGLISFGLPYMASDISLKIDVRGSLVALPILILSFGFHNLVPSLTTYLKRDKKALFQAIIIGSAIPLFVYLLWDFVILGLVSTDDVAVWSQAKDQGAIVTEVLASVCHSESVVFFGKSFAFFAVATSLLPVALSLEDFIKDALHSCTKNKIKKVGIALAVVIPPAMIAMTTPTLFLRSLGYAGGIAATLLFGVLPAMMAWKRRKQYAGHFTVGKPALLAIIIVVSVMIILIQLTNDLGAV